MADINDLTASILVAADRQIEDGLHDLSLLHRRFLAGPIRENSAYHMWVDIAAASHRAVNVITIYRHHNHNEPDYYEAEITYRSGAETFKRFNSLGEADTWSLEEALKDGWIDLCGEEG